MRPLNASDRVEDVQVENALDAPLRRGVELARLALVASLGGFARGYDAVVAATAVAQARDEFSAGRWLDYTAPGVAALGALAGAAFGGVASDAFGRKRVAFVCDALFIAGACLALSAPGALTFALARLVAGLASGASAANAPAFLLELAPRNIRGGVVAADAAAAAAGALAARIRTARRGRRQPVARFARRHRDPRGGPGRGHVLGARVARVAREQGVTPAGAPSRGERACAWRTSRRRRGRGSRARGTASRGAETTAVLD